MRLMETTVECLYLATIDVSKKTSRNCLAALVNDWHERDQLGSEAQRPKP